MGLHDLRRGRGCARALISVSNFKQPAFGFSRLWFTRVFIESGPSETEGAGNAGASAAPAASRARIESTRVSHHRSAETVRHSLHDGFYGFLRALPGDRAFLSPQA